MISSASEELEDGGYIEPIVLIYIWYLLVEGIGELGERGVVVRVMEGMRLDLDCAEDEDA